MNRPNEDQQNVITFEFCGRFFMSTTTYPLENVKTLIQIGHEPLKPYQTRTLFGTPVLGLPNIFKYVQHIYDVDVQGCYRGFVPWLSTTLLYRYSQKKSHDAFPKIPNEERNEDDLTKEERLNVFCGVLYRGVLSQAVATIVTQPLHVVTVRTIAQFVGNETKYSGIFSSFWTILKEEGITGLFSGLLPRLLSDILVYTFATTGVYLVHEYVTQDNDIKKYVDILIQYAASASFYSLTVVGNCMAVNDSGLAAGSLPNMPHYHHMFDCWSHLNRNNQLKRGSSILWRYYTHVSHKIHHKNL